LILGVIAVLPGVVGSGYLQIKPPAAYPAGTAIVPFYHLYTSEAVKWE
jgi:hypothetical protein